jgi:hypothetical protein
MVNREGKGRGVPTILVSLNFTSALSYACTYIGTCPRFPVCIAEKENQNMKRFETLRQIHLSEKEESGKEAHRDLVLRAGATAVMERTVE